MNEQKAKLLHDLNKHALTIQMAAEELAAPQDSFAEQSAPLEALTAAEINEAVTAAITGLTQTWQAYRKHHLD